LNALIQGSSAIHTKLWLLAVWRAGITPMLQIHDELFCSVKTREQGELIAKLGEEAVQLEVPMKIDIGFGRSWGDATHTWEDVPALPAAPVIGPTHIISPNPIAAGNVIELPVEYIAITELSPFDDSVRISESVDHRNRIASYPQ